MTLLLAAAEEADSGSDAPDAKKARRGKVPAPDAEDADVPAPVRRARRLLRDAMQGPRPPGAAADHPGPHATARPGQVGPKVDKYFGTKLPPVCARLGCYVTDDGKRFYCVNPSCQKHRKRETKHTRRGRPASPHFVYFRCPRCASRNVDMHVLSNSYACRACRHQWQR